MIGLTGLNWVMQVDKDFVEKRSQNSSYVWRNDWNVKPIIESSEK
jgi:hypothetical protein